MGGMNETGVTAYDLEPARNLMPHVEPLRHPGQPSPRPRWAPPSLPDGHVRVELEDDYYAGAYFSDWAATETDRPGEVFDIPREQYDRWVAARDAYTAMQDEIEAVREEHRTRRSPGWPQREGWVRKDKP
jgi:hypothetical protein